MGLTMITLAGLLRPLGRFLRAAGLSLRRAGRAQQHVPCRNGLHTAAGRGQVDWPARRSADDDRPLRVLRVVDAGHAPSSAGRMVISGRMADVCAELDRLAALEAAMA